MANRIMLNETSYRWFSAIQEIAVEARLTASKRLLYAPIPIS